jgi:hypothetical protein
LLIATVLGIDTEYCCSGKSIFPLILLTLSLLCFSFAIFIVGEKILEGGGGWVSGLRWLGFDFVAGLIVGFGSAVDQIMKPKGHPTWIRLMEPLGELDKKAWAYGLPEWVCAGLWVWVAGSAVGLWWL